MKTNEELIIEKEGVSDPDSALAKKLMIKIYPASVNKLAEKEFFIGRDKHGKSLFIFLAKGEDNTSMRFEGEVIKESSNGNHSVLKRCSMSHHNSLCLQETFPFTRAVPIGLTNSYGFGDRLGLANPGHLRALRGLDFMPVLAQQSIRELTRTQRTPEEVMDAAVWAVFQEGYKIGFGADADHLKTTEDVDRLVKAGFTMFTIDPSEHVVNGVSEIGQDELLKRVKALPWTQFGDTFENLVSRYENKKIAVSDSHSFTVGRREVLEACLKYNAAIIHIKKMHEHLRTEHPKHACEIEVSIDETDTVTTPFEHFYIVSELMRMGVKFVSLAPRFVGDFEKGIEYKGDIEIFKKDYAMHTAIADHFRFYKISFHSGSDKFRIYEAVASMKHGYVHVKTAGTSYLEALKVIAIREPNLFREILDYSVGLYETEKKSYFVSADMKRIKRGKEYKDSELEGLFSSNDVRQALHVTYGRVLTDKDEKSQFIFRERIYKCLDENEDLHYELLIKHFHRHMDPFKKGR